MAKFDVFDENVETYDAWFDENSAVYQVEIEAVRGFVPEQCEGLEIGAGTGRFASPLGIDTGVEPSPRMGALARQRGIEIIQSVAEALPFPDESFDFALMVTVDCFLDDIGQAFREVHRILRPEGSLIIGFIEKDSELGREYGSMKGQKGFFHDAEFHTAAELEALLKKTGFAHFAYRQTLFPGCGGVQEVEEGYGRGSFVVLRAIKEKQG